MSDVLFTKFSESFLVSFETIKRYIVEKHPHPDKIDWIDLTMALYKLYPASLNLGDYFGSSRFSSIEIRLIYRLNAIECI